MRECLNAPLRAASTRRTLTRRRETWRIGNVLTLKAPIMQAALGRCDGPRLAATVSRAGALGTMTVHAPEIGEHHRRLARIRGLTERPVLLAFTADWEPESILRSSLDAGFLDFQVFWWNGPRLGRRIHAAGGHIFWQVSSPSQARDALDAGADVLIAQGNEAGGQVRTPTPIRELIAEIRGLPGAESTPLIAGGGLATRTDVRAMLAAGADAALLGTRFLLSKEAAAPVADKLLLLRSDLDALMLDPRKIGEWPCAPRRRLSLADEHDRPSLCAGLGLGQIHALRSARAIVKGLTPAGSGVRQSVFVHR